MQWLRGRLVMPLTLLASVLMLAQAGSTASLAAGIAVVAIAALLGARWAAVPVRGGEGSIGERARQHRQGFVGMPEPRHPSTPGRRRSRAPSMGNAAA